MQRCASSALGSMRCIDRLIPLKHVLVNNQYILDMKAARLIFRFDTNSSATESSGVYHVECVEVYLQVNPDEVRCLGNDFLLIFQKADFHSFTLR